MSARQAHRGVDTRGGLRKAASFKCGHVVKSVGVVKSGLERRTAADGLTEVETERSGVVVPRGACALIHVTVILSPQVETCLLAVDYTVAGRYVTHKERTADAKIEISAIGRGVYLVAPRHGIETGKRVGHPCGHHLVAVSQRGGTHGRKRHRGEHGYTRSLAARGGDLLLDGYILM